MKNANLAPFVIFALALIGIADAFYDSYSIYNGQQLWCPPPIDGCNTVATSPHALVFGVPLGYLGLVFYSYIAGVAALLIVDPTSRALAWGAVVYAMVGVLGSMYFMYVQFAFIHAFCIYCLISALLTVLLLLAALVAQDQYRPAGARYAGAGIPRGA
jgi:uncharacterized membrane protein